MPFLSYRATLAQPSWPYLTGIADMLPVETAAGHFLYSGSEATGGITGFSLSNGGTASLAGQWLVNGHGGDFRLTDLALSQAGGTAHLITAETDVSAHIESYRLSSSGNLTGTGQLSYSGATPPATGLVHAFSVSGTALVATADPDTPGLMLWQENASGNLSYRSTLVPTPKVALEHISDIASLDLGTNTYMLTTSAKTNAISSFVVSASGQASLVDTLDNASGFWASGPDDITLLSAFGTQYAAVGGTNSSSITLMEVAQNGTLHVTDHVVDTLATRFSHIDALTSFNIGSRGFLLAGGGDDGLSLLEILPDGRLIPHESLAQHPGWSLADVTSIEAVDTGSEIQIFAAGTGEQGITQLTLPKASIANPGIGTAAANYFSGGSVSDLFYGDGGNDTLFGGGGDDVLYGGAGQDYLTGGAGADVFIFDADTATDRVQDFQLGTDKLDLGRWGRIYDAASLTIGARNDGALIKYDGHSVRLYSADGSRLDASDFSNDDFLFTGNGQLLAEHAASPGADSGALITGLGGGMGFGETALARSDDGSVTIDASALFSGGLHYFGNNYSGADISVNTNGTVSLGGALSAHPQAAGSATPQADVIAPFWADIDTRTDGFGPDSGQIWVDQNAAAHTLTVTWADVGAYRFDAGATNSFQLQLSDHGQGDFDISFRYGHIGWTDDGARAFLAGTRLPEPIGLSAAPLALDETSGNTGDLGVWTWQMRGGTVGAATTADGLVRFGTDAGDVLTGGADGDLLKGYDGPDILRGNDGADWLYGGDGADTLNAGAGADNIFGGDSSADLRDVVYAGAGNDTVDAGYGNDLVYGGDGDDDIAGGFGVDELIGQGGNDVITGSAWSDEIFGGEGDDFLNGGFGCDRLNGGSGADRFYHLGIADHGNDWIQDYNAAEGDVLLYGEGAGPATASDFLVQYTETAGAGVSGTEEAFITHIPSGLLMWALVDGADQDHIYLRTGGDTFDLLG